MLTAIIILDGYGYSEYVEGNAVRAAKTPVLDQLWSDKPHSFLKCSGLDVGLPPGQMGNSEVGHLNMGAGRIVYQELTRITKSIEDGDFFENAALIGAVEHALENGKALHALGLVSDGGVHSHNTHLYALLKLAKQKGLDRVYVHCFLDGRDTHPNSGLQFVQELMTEMKHIGVGKVATVSGRYFAMDRDNRWARIMKSYDALTVGFGANATDPLEAIQASYNEGITDEFVEPIVILEEEKPVAMIRPGDSVVFFNFRPDRARQMTRALTEETFEGFERKTGYLDLYYVTMTMYDVSLKNLTVAYSPQSVANTLGEYLSNAGKRQLRIAETEKYAHVTYFFNGGLEKEYPLEDRILVPSPKVATYDLKPEMSAVEVTDRVVEAIEKVDYDLIVLNYANCDMVGHTGVFDAAVKAVETVDACLGRVLKALDQKGGVALITADHGNAEQMIDPQTKKVFTAHTTNPVKCILYGRDGVVLRDGRLADLAPTLLKLQGMEPPEEMTGESLIVE